LWSRIGLVLAAFLVGRAIRAAHVRWWRSRNDDPDNPTNWIGLDYVHDRIMAQVDRQEARWKEVDDRLRFLLGVVGIVVATGVGFMRVGAPTVSGAAASSDLFAGMMPSAVGTFVVIAIVGYVLAGAMAAWAYRPQQFDRPPEPEEMRAEYVTTDPREAKIELIDTILLTYAANESKILRKFAWFGWAYRVAAISTLVMALALVSQIALQTRPWGS
jgi:hypothetical protein